MGPFRRMASILRRSGVACQKRLEAASISPSRSAHHRSRRSEPQDSVPAAPWQTISRLERDFFFIAGDFEAFVEVGDAVWSKGFRSTFQRVDPLDLEPGLAVVFLGLDG